MDENWIQRDSVELLEFCEKRQIPRFSRILRNHRKPTALVIVETAGCISMRVMPKRRKKKY